MVDTFAGVILWLLPRHDCVFYQKNCVCEQRSDNNNWWVSTIHAGFQLRKDDEWKLLVVPHFKRLKRLNVRLDVYCDALGSTSSCEEAIRTTERGCEKGWTCLHCRATCTNFWSTTVSTCRSNFEGSEVVSEALRGSSSLPTPSASAANRNVGKEYRRLRRKEYRSIRNKVRKNGIWKPPSRNVRPAASFLLVTQLGRHNPCQRTSNFFQALELRCSYYLYHQTSAG
jgi:hypothetical protein